MTNLKNLHKDSYFNYLSEDDRLRYKQKLTVEYKGTETSIPDPYSDIDPNEWNFDPVCWPTIEMAHIIGYFINKPGLYSLRELENYRSLEAYDIAMSGRVGSIGVINVSQGDGCTMILRAQVGHSQSFSASPLDVWVMVKKQGSLESAHCTCMAG